MTSIDYKEIYSRFYSKVMAFDLVEKPNEMLNDITYEQIHSVISQPYIRRLFLPSLMMMRFKRFTMK